MLSVNRTYNLVLVIIVILHVTTTYAYVLYTRYCERDSLARTYEVESYFRLRLARVAITRRYTDSIVN